MSPEMGVETGAVAVLAVPRTVTCGDHGGRRKDGQPCGQKVWGGRTRCPYHPEGVEGDALKAHLSAWGRVGSDHAKRPKPLHRKAGDPQWRSTDELIGWCEVMGGKVSRQEYTDWRALDAQMKLAKLALESLGLQALDQLDQLERLVRSRLGSGAAA